MSQNRLRPIGGASAITSQDIARLVGDLDERRALDILALKPTLAEVEEAAVWAAGDGDVLAKMDHPLGGVVAEIVDILGSDEEEPPAAH